MFHQTFTTSSTFESGLIRLMQRAFRAVCPQRSRHLLTIAAHGEPLTGTSLEVGDARIDLHFVWPFFRLPLEPLVVYLPACWGGYPAAIESMCAANDLGRTTFIGAMVDVRHKHAAQMQSRIIDYLLASNAPISELRREVPEMNIRLRRHYGGREVFRIVVDGEWYPRQGSGGLSAPIEHLGRGEVVATFQSTAGVFVVLTCPHGRFNVLESEFRQYFGSSPKEGPLQKKLVGRVLRPQGDGRAGRLILEQG